MKFLRKQASMVIGRTQSLSHAVELARRGTSIDVVGSRGSGRSTFLTALDKRLSDLEWSVVNVRGIASLRQQPLAALHLAGIGGISRSTNALRETADALTALVLHQPAAIVVDDWNDLDEGSWGVIEAVRRAHRTPVVRSRLQGLRQRHTPTGLPASTFESSHTIEMTPLRFDEMEHAITARVGGPIEASAMSRIYAKSGGNIGLAVDLVGAAMREEKLVLRDEQEWVAARDLWSPSLRAVLEGYIENLDSVTRDALEVIAIMGVASTDTVRKIVDWSAVEILEERSLVTFIPGGTSQLIAVVPPLLVEFLRHEPLSARRIRLTETIAEQLGSSESPAVFLSEPTPRFDSRGEGEALFVRMLHERARAQRIVAGAEWEALRTPAHALRHVLSLSQTYAPTVDATVRRIIDETDRNVGDPVERAQFIALTARWAAWVDHDLGKAADILARERDGLGSFARVLDAADVEIRLTTAALPEDFADRLEVTDDLPDIVKSELLGIQMLVLVAAARFADARGVYAKLEALSGVAVSPRQRTLLGLAHLGEGRHEVALDILLRGLDESKVALDIDGIRTFGTAAAMCHVHSGDYSSMGSLLETIFATGDVSPLSPGTQLGLLSVATLVAIRQGRVATGEKLAAEIERVHTPDGPLPGQAHAWAPVQLKTFEGESESAAAELWESSLALWDRGARFAGLTGMLGVAEIAPTAERIAYIEEKLRETPQASSCRVQFTYFAAVSRQDGEGILTAAVGLRDIGRIGMALAACRKAEALAQRKHDVDLEQRAARMGEALRVQHPGVEYDVVRFGASAVNLTEREQEVALLAAEGLSNQEIANRLVLSIRTVESHMHRVMRKLEVNSRHALQARLASSFSL